MPQIKSHMAGMIVEFLVKEGQPVANGQDVVCLESMKMQMFVQSSAQGKVKKLLKAPGEFVNEGDALIDLE